MNALLALLLATQADGLSLDRTVRLTLIDTLNRKREVHRKESVHVEGGKLAVVDHTFGGRLIVRPDLKLVWKADLLAGEYSELTFDGIAAVRRTALDELRSAKARVPGTPEEREIEAILEGLDQFAAEPKVELKTEGAKREIVLNGDRVRVSVEVDPARKGAAGAFEALGAIGAWPAAVSAKLREIEGLPVKGTVRYVLFLDRAVEQFEVTGSKEGAVPAGAFDLPPNLKKVPLAGFGPSPERNPAKPAALLKSFREDDKERSQGTTFNEKEEKKP